MNKKEFVRPRPYLIVAVSILLLLLGGCSGSDGTDGAQGPPGPVRTTTAESLDITIDKVTINSAPVVEFTIKDENGIPMTGLTTSNLRFNIAKLVPGTNGNPSAWQNYINREDDGDAGTFLQGYYERIADNLEDMGNGQFKYTFGTDITDPTQTVGNISYDPTLTHRVAIQVSGFAAANPTYDFRPDGAAITVQRDIVKTENCNSCHNKLAMHGGGRIETKYCVTCHNPGTNDADNGNTADFKVMIHKIHRGEDLPSGDPYEIGGHDYSTVVFPQDIRNCTKCHDGSDPMAANYTPQGDNWKTQLSMEACGSCHDDIDFSKDGRPAPLGAGDPDGHPGGIMTDNSLCLNCHTSGLIAGSVEESHYLAEPAARAKFKINILKICGVDVGTTPGPICAPGTNPSVTFSVTDPTNSNAEYDLDATPEIANSNLSFLVAWDTADYHNNDGTGTRPSSADSIDFDEAGYVDAGNTRTVTASFIIPDGTGANGYTATGSGAVGSQGRLAGDFDGDTVYGDRIYVKSEVAYFSIDGDPVEPRREVVDNAKCNQCHEQLNIHGGNRNGEALVCVLCHNPNNTDINRRLTFAGSILDGKAEESIDFKRLIHGIHAGAQTLYDDTEGHGFRENGLVVYGYGTPPTGDPSSEHDFSHVRFPGILNDCETCHKSGTYELAGTWELPTLNGILGSTIDTSADVADPADDGNISPTAAVCSSCHDDALAQTHMENEGAVFNALQGNINDYGEVCAVCHGPGHIADVEVVHGIE